MDDFKKAGARSVGPGGIKCRCCFIWHWYGNHQRKLNGFSKLRRARLKRELKKLLLERG